MNLLTTFGELRKWVPLWLLALVLVITTAGCQHTEPNHTATLDGSHWRFIEFQSMDDAVGTKRPPAGQTYTMTLMADGSVAMQLNCNRGSGTWRLKPSQGGSGGSFEFGPLATTRALCPQPSMDETLAQQSRYVRSYVLENDTLYLNLMADGGTQVWTRATSAPDKQATK